MCVCCAAILMPLVPCQAIKMRSIPPWSKHSSKSPPSSSSYMHCKSPWALTERHTQCNRSALSMCCSTVTCKAVPSPLLCRLQSPPPSSVDCSPQLCWRYSAAPARGSLQESCRTPTPHCSIPGWQTQTMQSEFMWGAFNFQYTLAPPKGGTRVHPAPQLVVFDVVVGTHNLMR